MNNEFLNGMSLRDLDCLYRLYQEKYAEMKNNYSKGNYQTFEEAEMLLVEENDIKEEMKIIKSVIDERFNTTRNIVFGINNKSFGR